MPSEGGGDKRLFAFLRLRCKHYLVPFHWAAMLIKTTETRQFSFPTAIGCRWKWVNCGYLLGPETRDKAILGLGLNNLDSGGGLYKAWRAVTWHVTTDIEVDWHFEMSTVRFQVLNRLWMKRSHTTSTLSKTTFSQQQQHVEHPRGQQKSTDENWTTNEQALKSLWQFSKGKYLDRQTSSQENLTIEQRSYVNPSLHWRLWEVSVVAAK